MSPDSLMEEFNTHVEDTGSGECSQLYETGGQEVALKSANREINAEDARESRREQVSRVET